MPHKTVSGIFLLPFPAFYVAILPKMSRQEHKSGKLSVSRMPELPDLSVLRMPELPDLSVSRMPELPVLPVLPGARLFYLFRCQRDKRIQ